MHYSFPIPKILVILCAHSELIQRFITAPLFYEYMKAYQVSYNQVQAILKRFIFMFVQQLKPHFYIVKC